VNRTRCRVTHWVVPSASVRSPREPRFLRMLREISGKVTERVYRARLLVVVILLAGVAAGCGQRLDAPMQPDGWSAQPIVIGGRFSPDADLDPASGMPVGDEAYFLYILTDAANWDFSDATSLFL
jgi:hypothetical protein